MVLGKGPGRIGKRRQETGLDGRETGSVRTEEKVVSEWQASLQFEGGVGKMLRKEFGKT